MFVALVIVHVVVAVSLVLIVLLQTGRGAELGAAFGGLGQATYGRGQSTFISKLTTVMAIIFMSTSLSLAFISIERPRSSILTPADSRPVTPGQSASAPQQPSAAGSPLAQPGTSLPQTDAPRQQGAGAAQ